MDIRSIRHTAKLAEWSERIHACRTSGLTVKAWCAQQGFNTKTYYRWERLYMAEAAVQTGTRVTSSAENTLVRIEPKQLPAAIPVSATVCDVQPLLLRYGSAVLEFPADTSAGRIAALLKLLREND